MAVRQDLTIHKLRVTRCRHVRRRAGECWEFRLSQYFGTRRTFFEAQSILHNRIQPITLKLKMLARRVLHVRALCERCA